MPAQDPPIGVAVGVGVALDLGVGLAVGVPTGVGVGVAPGPLLLAAAPPPQPIQVEIMQVASKAATQSPAKENDRNALNSKPDTERRMETSDQNLLISDERFRNCVGLDCREPLNGGNREDGQVEDECREKRRAKVT